MMGFIMIFFTYIFIYFVYICLLMVSLLIQNLLFKKYSCYVHTHKHFKSRIFCIWEKAFCNIFSLRKRIYIVHFIPLSMFWSIFRVIPKGVVNSVTINMDVVTHINEVSTGYAAALRDGQTLRGYRWLMVETQLFKMHLSKLLWSLIPTVPGLGRLKQKELKC